MQGVQSIKASRDTGVRAELIRNREFLSLWFVGATLNTLRWLEILAVGVVVFEITASPLYVALVVFLRFLPMVFLGFLTGAISERINRRLGLITIMFLMTFASLFFAITALTGQVTLWLIAASVMLNGLLWAFDNPVRRTLFADVVRPEQLGIAMTLDSFTNNSTRFLGPFFGGLFLEFSGIEGVFFLGSLFYALATLATVFGTRITGRQIMDSSGGLLSALANGLVVLRQKSTLPGIMAVTVIYNVWGFPFVSMIPVIGKEVLGLSPLPLGILVSAEGLGALTGALLIVVFAKVSHYRKLYTYGLFLFLVMALAFSQVSDFFPAAVFLFLTGVGAGCFSAMQGTLVMFCTPLEARGRMMGLLSVCIGLCTVGFLHIGLLANWLGAELAIAVSAVEGIVALVLVWRICPEIVAPQTLPSDSLVLTR